MIILLIYFLPFFLQNLDLHKGILENNSSLLQQEILLS